MDLIGAAERLLDELMAVLNEIRAYLTTCSGKSVEGVQINVACQQTDDAVVLISSSTVQSEANARIALIECAVRIAS